jgi:hypothetical protein
MFRDCTLLTTIPQIDTTGMTTMSGMLQGCGIKQNLSWLKIEDCSICTNFLNGANINDTGTTNYDALLNSFASQPRKLNVPFHGGTSKYSAAASLARETLVAAGWTITDGGLAT